MWKFLNSLRKPIWNQNQEIARMSPDCTSFRLQSGYKTREYWAVENTHLLCCPLQLVSSYPSSQLHEPITVLQSLESWDGWEWVCKVFNGDREWGWEGEGEETQNQCWVWTKSTCTYAQLTVLTLLYMMSHTVKGTLQNGSIYQIGVHVIVR